MATVPVSDGVGVVKIEALIAFACCGLKNDESFERLIGRGALGATLGKIVCDGCGSEYTIGVLVASREESLASEAFEAVADEKLDEIGVDRADYEPSDEEPALCVGCDGDVDRRTDFCTGCKDYVCQTCRKLELGNVRRHMSEEHWIAPAAAAQTESVSANDGSSFVAEEEL